MQKALIVFLFCAVAFSLFTVGRILLTFSLFDFVNGYYPALRDLLSGRGLYDNPELDILYPPTTFLFLLPFGFTDTVTGQKIWTFLSYLSLIASLILLLRAIHKLNFTTLILFYSLAMLSFPVKFTLGMGQVNHFVLLFLCLAFYSYTRNKQAETGVYLGIATALKITPFILILFLLRKKQWQAICCLLVTLAVIVFITGSVFGWDLYRQFLFRIVPHIPTTGNTVYYAQSFTAFLARLNIPTNLSRLANAIVFSLLVVSGYFLTTPRKTAQVGRTDQVLADLTEYGLFVAVALIGAGHALQHHFVFLIIPFIPLFFNALARSIYFQFCLLTAYLLISANMKHPAVYSELGSNLLLSHVFYGTFLLWGLLVNVLISNKRKTQASESLEKRQVKR